MAELVPPERATFQLTASRPLLRLDVAMPEGCPTAGWSVVNMVTMCVLDGPGEFGYLVPRFGPDGLDTAPAGWDHAVERENGCDVVLGLAPGSPRLSVPAL